MQSTLLCRMVQQMGDHQPDLIQRQNDDGRIQYVGDPVVNELEVNRDIMVLANPEIANLPNWVVALVAAGPPLRCQLQPDYSW